MKALTIKQILDKAGQGVIGQGTLSKKASRCYYRHPQAEGCACGVGHLIKDEHYNVACENSAAGRLAVAHEERPDTRIEALAVSLYLSGVDVDAPGVINTLGNIQDAHDNAKSVTDFAQKLESLYENRDLAVPQWLSKAAAA